MLKSASKLTEDDTPTKTGNELGLPSKPKSKSSLRSTRLDTLDSKEILKLEYEQLNQWARHGEEAAHRIFNFYVTLLSATLGGFIVIAQLVNGYLQTAFLIGSAACGLLVIIGVTFLDALIGQYSRNIQYRIGIEMIRNYFRQDSTVAGIINRSPIATLETDSETMFYTIMENRLSTTQIRERSKLIQLLTLLFPVSSQLIFLSMVTSLLVGAFLWLLVWGLAGVGFELNKMVLTSTLVVAISFLSQNIMVRIALQRPLDNLRKASETRAELHTHQEK